MNYNEGINHMLTLSSGKGSFSPYTGITITYPGYKGKGDYRLTLEAGYAPTHSTISKKLYNLIIDKEYTFQTLEDFLSDIYTNGTNTSYTDTKLQYLQQLIYWLTLQEEINYPRSKKYAGINLAFCRFYEAIYSTKPTSTFTIQDVQNRCNNHGRNKPNLYHIPNSPNFYHY